MGEGQAVRSDSVTRLGKRTSAGKVLAFASSLPLPLFHFIWPHSRGLFVARYEKRIFCLGLD